MLQKIKSIATVSLLALGLSIPGTSEAQSNRTRIEEPGLRFGFEVKAHWRDSEATRLPIPPGLFQFPPIFLPVGQDVGFLETVEEGSHAELSNISLWLEGSWARRWSGRLKVDFIDRYERNPTSSGDEIDIDEAWIRWGDEVLPGELGEHRFNGYAKLGKFAKFERQNDRHLESYGLLSTAFNRLEDVGLELGFDLWRRLYLKASYTQGNPLFIRDVNALAGENGPPEREFGSPNFVPNAVPDLKSGFPILYDTDVDDIAFDDPEVGLGLGLRLGGDDSPWSLDLLAFAYDRDLADEVDLPGTFYGGDLDLLFGPFNSTPLPLTDREKHEKGANLWFYAGSFSAFAQYVDQEIGGLPRDGFEIELAYAFELPYFAAAGGRQMFSYIAPAIRYSEIDNDFALQPFPAPSIFWDWEKTDIGLRLGLIEQLLDLTAEWSDNEFIRAGRAESADEFLLTVRWAMEWDR